MARDQAKVGAKRASWLTRHFHAPHIKDVFLFRKAAIRGPAFYQSMARMEDAGFVEGWYEQQIVAAQIIRERHYRITALGRRSWNETGRFYAIHGEVGSTGSAHG